MHLSTNKLLTEKFCSASKLALSDIEVTKPWSVPYNENQHGNSLEEFQQYPAEFSLFRDKYYALVDQLFLLSCGLKLPETTLQTLNENLETFKEHLFNPGYCNAHPNILWNNAREHLERLIVLLNNRQISEERRTNIINNLSDNLLMCSSGIVSHLQEAIQTLVSDGEVILNAKERLIQQLVIKFVQDHKLCNLGMEGWINATSATWLQYKLL